MQYNEFIERNPAVLNGEPVIKGTRITVELIARKMAHSYTPGQLLESYPHLQKEQISACLNYAADLVSGEVVTHSV